MLATEIKTELLAEWNQSKLAIGTNIYIKAKTETIDKRSLPEIRILDGQDDKEPEGNGDVDIAIHPMILEGFAKTDMEAEAIYEEVRRIVNAKVIAGGWWHLASKYYDDQKRAWRVVMNVIQKKFEVVI